MYLREVRVVGLRIASDNVLAHKIEQTYLPTYNLVYHNLHVTHIEQKT